jgi:hypothetical protein
MQGRVRDSKILREFSMGFGQLGTGSFQRGKHYPGTWLVTTHGGEGTKAKLCLIGVMLLLFLPAKGNAFSK